METIKRIKVTGKYLIALGFEPAKWFGEVLETINGKGSEEFWTTERIKTLCNSKILESRTFIERKLFASDYEVFLEGNTEDEKANILSVKATMNEIMHSPVVIGGEVMPDACPAGPIGTVPVGGVVYVNNAIVPSYHSADICCSLMLSEIDVGRKQVLDAASKITHFGYGSNSRFKGWLPQSLLKKIRDNPFTRDFEKSAMDAIGTQGDGNHFLYVGSSSITGNTCLVTHHGSRSFGAKVFKRGREVAEALTKTVAPSIDKSQAWIPMNCKAGKDYWKALQIVREWTKLNHETIHYAIAGELGLEIHNNYWNEHNFVFRDGDTFVHAKEATPLDKKYNLDAIDRFRDNGLRIIPMNMSEPILIVRKGSRHRGFAPHGAGRNYSRAEHARRNSNKTSEEIFTEETKGLDIRSFSGVHDISELPSAYKNAKEVERQINKFRLANIVDRINPYGCIMAGKVEQHWKKK